ncbi:MAG: amidohydrolase family protein [Armatimonadota bacterium]
MIKRKKLFCVLLLLAFIISIFFTLPAFSQKKRMKQRPPDKELKYIDVHMHISAKVGNNWDYDGAMKKALFQMNKLGIKKIIIMPPPFTPENNAKYTYKDLASAVKKYPGRFDFLGGGGTLNVMIQKSVKSGKLTEGMKQEFKNVAEDIAGSGAVGFGELACEHLSLGPAHGYHSAPPNHPLFLLLADIAAEHNMPVDIHMEAVPQDMPPSKTLKSDKNPPVLKANIEPFEKLLEHNRKAKIIWDHVGWDNTGERTVELTRNLLKKHPNLYMSFKICGADSLEKTGPVDSSGNIKAEWLELIKEFPDRFVIGADEFISSPRSKKRVGVPSLESTYKFAGKLPPNLIQKLYIENPKSIFNLK